MGPAAAPRWIQLPHALQQMTAARYESAGPQESRVSVKGPAAGLLLVRNQWDENWKAAVDGRPAPVLPADGAFQAVPVPGD